MKTRHWWRTRPNALLRFLALSISVTLASLTCFQTPLPAASRRISYYHTDHLGSTTTVTNEQGQVVAHAEYTPYGATVTQTGTPQPAHQFTGQRLDTDTGLYYYKARYYDPQLGRFIQPDIYLQNPSDPQSFNRYSYVRNNPVNLVDPSGYSFWSVFKRVYVALVTFGMSETIPATTNAIVKLSDKAGIDPRYPLALYSAVVGAATGGIGWGVGAAVSGAVTSFGTSLAMASGEGRQITRKVAKEFFMDVVGMSPRSAYTAASITISTAIAAGIQLLGFTANSMRKTMWEQSTINPKNSSGISAGHKGDGHKLAGGRYNAAHPNAGSPLGGAQGGPGKFFGIPYKPNSGLDLLLETFAGPHDYLNSWFAYDASGNIRQGISVPQKIFGQVMNWTDVPLSIPFGVSGAVSPEATAGIAGTGLMVDQSKYPE